MFILFVFIVHKISQRGVNGLILNSGALGAKRASGAPWVRKFGKLSIQENLEKT